MSSHAERFTAAKARVAHAKTELAAFERVLDFELDPFQTQGCGALEAGHGVLVAAPTGAGKTVVGEFAIHLALAAGRKAFYTTPIKALSNQKYHEFSRRWGSERVGLLTGDTSVNSEADVVVMTTEVLRNMLYADSATLTNLGFVVMDEVHYLADRFRGAVWEEVIIHLPEHVQLASLSATVSNAEEFGAWLHQVRGTTDVVVSEHRPVPLWQHVQVGHELLDLFVDDTVEQAAERHAAPGGDEPEVNPELLRLFRTQHPRGGRAGAVCPAGWCAVRDERGGPGAQSVRSSLSRHSCSPCSRAEPVVTMPAMRSRIARSSVSERHTPEGASEATGHHAYFPSCVLELGTHERSLTRQVPSAPRANWNRTRMPWLLFSVTGGAVSVTLLPTP